MSEGTSWQLWLEHRLCVDSLLACRLWQHPNNSICRDWRDSGSWCGFWLPLMDDFGVTGQQNLVASQTSILLCKQLSTSLQSHSGQMLAVPRQPRVTGQPANTPSALQARPVVQASIPLQDCPAIPADGGESSEARTVYHVEHPDGHSLAVALRKADPADSV